VVLQVVLDDDDELMQMIGEQIQQIGKNDEYL